MSGRLAVLAAAVAMLEVGQSSPVTTASPYTIWTSGTGSWSDQTHWSAGVPAASRTATIAGRSDVTVPAGSRAVTGGLEIGISPDQRARLRIEGGEVIVRRKFMRLGEHGSSEAEIVLANGALHCASFVYLGGASRYGKHSGTATARIKVQGGSFVARLVTVGEGLASEATFEVDGSRASAVHVMDYLSLYAPDDLEGTRARATLSFVLDEHGVTPITIESRHRNGGLRIQGDYARLTVALEAVPPRDDITLVAAGAPTRGAFRGLPEGAEVSADHDGRTYRWTLTYRGGASGHDLALTKARGFAGDDPATRVRARPEPPTPLWLDTPAVDTPPQDGPLTFEGAEGFGARTPGGRGGRTLIVDNLNDAGDGSLRHAVETPGPRIIEFRVGGIIELRSPLVIREPFVTLLGQSAPDPGIELRHHGVVVNTHDVILRYLRIRPGDTGGIEFQGPEGEDALTFADARRCIADHLSASWGSDEVLSITGLSDEITIQWTIISEGLNAKGHGLGSLAGGHRVTWHHNLFAHHASRMPRFSEVVHADFRNNVLYNWGHTAGYGEFERLNYVGNYLKTGPSTVQEPPLFHNGDSVVTPGSLFVAGNILEGHAAVNRNNRLGTRYGARVYTAKPWPAPRVATDTAAVAYDRVLRGAGATRPHRDAVDERIAREVREGAGRIIDSVADVGGWPAATRARLPR